MGEEEGSLVRQIAKERKRRIAEKGETNKDTNGDTNMNHIMIQCDHKCDTNTNAKLLQQKAKKVSR